MVLQDIIEKCFMPAYAPCYLMESLFDAELQLFALPTCLAGLGVVLDPNIHGNRVHINKGTVIVANALKGMDVIEACNSSCLDALNEARQLPRNIRENLHQSNPRAHSNAKVHTRATEISKEGYYC